MKRAASVLALVLVSACGSESGVATTTSTLSVATTNIDDPRTPVIFDYSPTVSDVDALVFLATSPDLRLIGVTLPGTGESHCEPGVAHTRGVLAALDLGDVPVSCGVDEGYGGLNPFPAGWRERSDTMTLPEAESADDTPLPVDLMAELITSSTRPVEIVAVGPLTNLALLLDAHPEVAGGIGGITIMGGAVDVPGNVPVFAWANANEHAEVNFWVDPAAAARVLASGLPITLVPLDATNYLPTDARFRSALLSSPYTPASLLLGAVWRDAPEWIDGYYLWDELAAAILADSGIVEFETRSLVVDTADDTVAGWSREDSAGAPVRVAVSADRIAFETLFLSTVLGRPVTIERLVATAAEREYFSTLAAMNEEFDRAQAEVFTAAAEGLGVDLDNADEESFGEVMLEAIPQVLAGPMAALLAALEDTSPPESLASLHASWVSAFSELVAHQDEVMAAFEGFLSGGGEILELPYFAEIEEACVALTEAAADRGVVVNIGC